MTTEQVRNKTKTVTRRNGWLWLVEACSRGERPLLQPIVKGQGLKRGEHVEKIGCPIEVVRAKRIPLFMVTPAECAREGFPSFTPEQFVAFYLKANGPTDTVTRIEFRYRPDKQS